MQPLDIVYCKDCRHYRCKIVDANSSVHMCLLNKDVQITNPSLYCNKSCYSKRKQKSKSKIKAQKEKS